MGISDSLPGVYKSRIDKSTSAITTGGTGAAATVITSDRGYINMPYEVYATELGKFYNIFGAIKPINVSDYGKDGSGNSKALMKLGHHTVSMFLRIGEKITVVRNYSETDQYAYNTYRTTGGRLTDPITAALTDKSALDSKDRVSAIDNYVSTKGAAFNDAFVIARPYPSIDDNAELKSEIAVEIQEFGFGCSWMNEYDAPTIMSDGSVISTEKGAFHITGNVTRATTNETDAITLSKLKLGVIYADNNFAVLAKDSEYTVELKGNSVLFNVIGGAQLPDTTATYRAYYTTAANTVPVVGTSAIFTKKIHKMSFANIRKNFPIASSVVKLNVYSKPVTYDWSDIDNGTTIDTSKLNLVESFQGSLQNYVDVGGNSIYIEDVINGKSTTIYIKGDSDGVNMDLEAKCEFTGQHDQYTQSGLLKKRSQFLKLYNAYVKPENQATYDKSLTDNEANIWGKLSEPTTVDASLLISYNPMVAYAVVEAANRRKDAAAIIQVGHIFQPTDITVNSALTGFIDPAITFAYARYGKVFVPDTGKASFLPMSIIAGYLHSRIETVYDIKDLPAGYDYGEVPILDIDINVGTSDAIAFGDAHINTVIKKPKAGYVMWNAKTMEKRVTPLNRTAPVRVLLSIMKDIGESLDSQVFRINSAENRAKIERMGNNYLSTLISLGRITNGQVFCDELNNNEEVRKQKKMYVDMGVTFPGYSEFIYFTAIVGDDGVTLSDLRIQR